MALGGYLAPSFMLEKKIKKRQDILRLALPDALDLMVISVEAGLGLDQAISYVATELHNAHPELTDEFQMVNLEIRAGKRRSDALKNLGERSGEPELRKLTAILIQNDRFGTSIEESLRQHSDYMTCPAHNGWIRRPDARDNAAEPPEKTPSRASAERSDIVLFGHISKWSFLEFVLRSVVRS
jgi:hypothetical protein